MSDYLTKIQKHLFAITLATAIFLGFATAHLAANLFPVFLPVSSLSVPASRGVSSARQSFHTEFKSVDEFMGVISGNLIRDSVPILGGSGPEPVTPVSTEGVKEFELLGVVAGSPSFARAAIQLVGEAEANEYKIKDTVGGYTITHIYTNAIKVERAGTKLTVFIGEKTSDLAKPPDTNLPPAAAGTQRITLSRSRVLSLISNQAEIYKAKFTPIQRNGKIAGLRFLYIPSDNVLYELGARTNDIIRRINGQPLDNMEKMMEFYQSLKTADRVTVEVERSGNIIPFEIIIN